MIDIRGMCLQRVYLAASQPEAAELSECMADNHSPEFEPYASMDRVRIAELMDQAFRAGDAWKWYLLESFLLDKLDIDELKVDKLTCELTEKVIREFGIWIGEDVEAIVRGAYEVASLACELAKGAGEA